MAHFALNDFFRKAPKQLLGRFFRERRLLTHIDFEELKTRDTSAILELWNQLPEKDRQDCEAELMAIQPLRPYSERQYIQCRARHQDGAEARKSRLAFGQD